MPGLDGISDFTLIEDGGSVISTVELVGFGEGGFGEGPFGGGEILTVSGGLTVWTNITTP